jgi:hypothetical protein
MNKAKYLNDVLTSMEADDIISSRLKEITLDSIGSEDFVVHHAMLERLNMQAVKNALLGGDDFILETFVSYDKMKSLICELFTIYQFKSWIYPKIKNKVPEAANCKLYICIYHEAVVLNLLENFFFHLTACQASEDFIVDVIEYCYSKISQLVFKSKKTSINEGIDEKFEEIEFYLSMASISTIRYICDHLNTLPFPIKNHLMNVKDMPMLLVALMEFKPWLKETEKNKKTERFLYENNTWISFEETSAKLPKLEAQVWISLYNLLMNTENNKKYEITDFRKNNLLRLRKYMNESLYDHIPPLQQFYRRLEEMSLMEHSSLPLTNPFVVEMVPLLFNKKLSESEIDRISDKILNDYFPSDYNHSRFKKEMDIMSDIYSMNNIEYFMEDPKCANCGKEATNRCSKCKSEWYCGRDCQIRRWKQHKEVCAKLAEIFTSPEDEKKDISSFIKPVKEIKKEVKEIVESQGKVKEFEELD